MQATLEYMILIPILILQIFLFPIFVTSVVNNWVDQRRELALEEIAGHIGSSIQQIYYSLNHTRHSKRRLDKPIGHSAFC